MIKDGIDLNFFVNGLYKYIITWVSCLGFCDLPLLSSDSYALPTSSTGVVYISFPVVPFGDLPAASFLSSSLVRITRLYKCDILLVNATGKPPGRVCLCTTNLRGVVCLSWTFLYCSHSFAFLGVFLVRGDSRKSLSTSRWYMYRLESQNLFYALSSHEI